MKIARRTSGGRGEYEVAGSASGFHVPDLLEKELVVRLPGEAAVRTGVIISVQGGKPRLKLKDGTIQIQRQLAALLLLPKPIRADDAMKASENVIRANQYAIETIDIDTVIPGEDEFVIRLGEITCRDAMGTVTIPAYMRYRRIRSLWTNSKRFAPSVRNLLDSHKQSVLSGGPLGEDVERLVERLVQETGSDDPVDALDLVPSALVTPLCAKPFLILTGPAGTGKSHSGIDLGLWLDYGQGLPPALEASRINPSTALALVPVGADWTDQRNLLGFRNPFGSPRPVPGGGETNLTYEITPIVRLLLRAAHPEFQDEPHILLLDEMNLSHVERYFSTFLSILEADRSAGEVGAFYLIDRDDLALIADVLEYEANAPIEVQSARTLVAAGHGLGFPANVFIVGTVNVDETTYMFSPKVLDRAFVQELHAVSPAAALTGGPSPGPIASGMAILEAFSSAIQARRHNTGITDPLESLRKAATDAGLTDPDADDLAEAVVKSLSGAFKLLSPVGFGFGYRVLNEVITFLIAELILARPLGRDPTNWIDSLDQVILMKVLPKLHGNRRKLLDSLSALAAFFRGEEAPAASYAFGAADVISIAAEEKLGQPLPACAAKAADLHRSLQANGYTTFIS